MSYFLSFALSLALAVVLTPVIKKLAVVLNIFDKPVQTRKIHDQPIPLLGGIAIFLAVIVSILIFGFSGQILDQRITLDFILGIIIGGLIIMVGGFLDDRYNLAPNQQIIWPILAVIVVMMAGIRISFVTNPLGGVLDIPLGIGLIVTFFWILGMMYTTKLLDGLDGLATGISLIGFLIIFIVSLFWDVKGSGTSILALVMAGACAGFLIFNFHPAKIFLGEGGSIFLGFMLSTLSIISGSKIATALLVMGIPIIDVIIVIFKRLKSRKPISIGDQSHLHFRLLKRGFSQRQIVILFYGVTLTFGVLSLFFGSIGKIIALVALILVMVIFIKFLAPAKK